MRNFFGVFSAPPPADAEAGRTSIVQPNMRPSEKKLTSVRIMIFRTMDD